MDSTEANSIAEFGNAVDVEVHDSKPSILIVCEHASNHVPEIFNGLGLSQSVLQSHVAWDPGALGVARAMAGELPSVLLSGTISRLVYDCNRPPEATSAIPERSERFRISGNIGLTKTERSRRIKGVFEPFSNAITDQIAQSRDTLELMITVHSFTPVFNGERRTVELGVLHGNDDRFATAMMRKMPEGFAYDTRLNEPYAARDGVVHTLDAHGVKSGLLNAMIEIRNDLIETSEAQRAMARHLASWIGKTLDDLRREDRST